MNLIPDHQHFSQRRTIAKFSKESERFKRQSVLVKDSFMHPGELVWNILDNKIRDNIQQEWPQTKDFEKKEKKN